jgi:broad specificity phosphatase PhoE
VPSSVAYLVRHGRTRLNAEGRYRGRADVPLDADGRRQAEEAADELGSVPLVGVYSSPLRRAAETAAPIAARRGFSVGTVADLIDLDHGLWEGMNAAEAEARDPEAFAVWRSELLEAVPPGGEPVADALDRAEKALREILLENAGRMVAAVSHEIIIRGLLARVHGLGGEWVWRFRVDPGSVHRLRMVGERLVPA